MYESATHPALTTPSTISSANGVRATGLGKRFGDLWALRDLDLEIPPGSVLGLLGHNGAGKTTAIRLLTTLSIPTTGSATVAGFDVASQPDQVRSQIGVAGQQATVDGLLTGRANLEMVGRLYHLSAKASRDRAEELLDRLDLADAADRLVKTYSGGMRRRLDLAASLVANPPVLFLDEPTTGLDPASRRGLWVLISELVREGATLLLTTQYLEEADELADEIIVFDHGRVAASGSPAELKSRVGGERFAVTVPDGENLQPVADALRAVRRRRNRHRRRSPPGDDPGPAGNAPDGGRQGARRSRRRGDRRAPPRGDARRRLPLPDHQLNLRGGGRMSAIDTTINPNRLTRMRWLGSDSLVYAKRRAAHIRQIPEKLIDVTVQPLMFVLLFAFVFGGVIAVPGGNYREYLIGGILVQTLAFGMMGPASSMATDLTEGIVDRFRTLPGSRSAFLLGHLIAELAGMVLAITVLSLSGLLVGWEIHSDLLHAMAGYGLLITFAFAMLWIGTLIGVVVRSPDAVMGVGFLIVFPMTFLASTFVPIDGFPNGLQQVAEWNPISALAAATRDLFGNPTAISAGAPWPMAHPILASLAWCAVLSAIAIPLTLRAFRSRTTD